MSIFLYQTPNFLPFSCELRLFGLYPSGESSADESRHVQRWLAFADSIRGDYVFACGFRVSYEMRVLFPTCAALNVVSYRASLFFNTEVCG